MMFADIPSGENVFFDANTFIFHFINEPKFGQACTDLIVRAGIGDIVAHTSTHAMSEVSHRLMTIEAERVFGWPMAAIGKKLRKNPVAIQSLNLYSKAIRDILAFSIRILNIDPMWIQRATQLSDAHGLLSNDALIVAAMEAHGITAIASNDSDFDRVPTLRRYAPV